MTDPLPKYQTGYDQGYAAYLAQASRNSNPYQWWEISGQGWLAGFSDAEKLNPPKTTPPPSAHQQNSEK